MKKILISIFLISFIFNSVNANEIKKTDEELIAEFMQLVEREKKAEKDINEVKAKTKEYDKLEKTVDELAKTLGVDK